MTDPCYIARKGCGCIVAITAEEGYTRAEVARRVSKWIRDGYAIEHIEAEAFRNGSAGKFGCKCGKAKAQEA